MHPLTENWKIVRRDKNGYTVVEDRLEDRPALADAKAYYREFYAHDDANNTEVMFIGDRGTFDVIRIYRPCPPVEMILMRVKR